MENTTPDDKAFSFIAKLDVLSLCSEEAAEWLREFRETESYGLATNVFRAMVLFRQHKVEEAGALLDGVRDGLAAQRARFPSIVCLLRRWLLSARAYQRYLDDDLEAARRALAEARDEIRTAIEMHPFLIPVATHCIDFEIQLARLARRENRWLEVKRHLDLVRKIYADERPFCVLTSGRPIRISDLRAFYRSLPLDDKQQQDLRSALDPDYPHWEWIDRLEENVFTLPDLVIPYP